jgi:nitrate reductase gamma subunit
MGRAHGVGYRACVERNTVMTGVYIMLGGMVLFASIIGILDLLARRQERKHHKG